MLRKTLLVKRTLKLSSDQGEAPSGPCCQVPGFPGEQDDCPLVLGGQDPGFPAEEVSEGGDQDQEGGAEDNQNQQQGGNGGVKSRRWNVVTWCIS